MNKKDALESIKNRATNQLLQFIISASKGSEYINKQSLRTIIDDITMSACLETQLMINEALKIEKESITK